MVVEIKARFDEQANIAWARKLEEAGCHVVYGFVGLKTHCKLVLVVREEPDGTLRRYCHVGTGNYHPKTARIYEDLGLLTADPAVGEDVTDLFNHLTGYSRKSALPAAAGRAGVAAGGLVDRIDRAGRHGTGRASPARIQFKANALVDEAMIDALYRGLAGRGAGRPVGARHLLDPARAAGPVGTIRVQCHPGPVPRAFPHLLRSAPARTPTVRRYRLRAT